MVLHDSYCFLLLVVVCAEGCVECLQVDHLTSEVARLMALVPGAHANGKESKGLAPTNGKDTLV